MAKYRVTFEDENGKKKTYVVKAMGIIPAIEEAIRKQMVSGWFGVPVKAEEIK